MHALVDAFWKGRSKFKRGKNSYFDDYRKPTKACYIGAIYYGLYKKVGKQGQELDEISKDWSQIRYWTAVPCGCDDEGGVISAILIHLNDEHDARIWSDKKISEWLEATFDGKAYPSREEYDKAMQKVRG